MPVRVWPGAYMKFTWLRSTEDHDHKVYWSFSNNPNDWSLNGTGSIKMKHLHNVIQIQARIQKSKRRKKTITQLENCIKKQRATILWMRDIIEQQEKNASRKL